VADSPIDRATLVIALDSLLAQHPSAYVAAVGPNGLFVPMPAEITLCGQQVLVARSALDVIVPSDRVTVINTWERARAVGAAHTQVRLASEPGRTPGPPFLRRSRCRRHLPARDVRRRGG
jgi:hypothetical protein